MKIAVDCRALRKKPAGVPNFLIACVNELIKQKHEVFLLSNQPFEKNAESRLDLLGGGTKVIEPLFMFKNLAIAWYILKVPFLLRKIKPDFFYTPTPSLPFFIPKRVKSVIEVNDMVYKLFPNTMSYSNWFLNKLFHDRSIRVADKIWAISEYTKSEVENLFLKRRCQTIFVGGSIDKSVFFKRNISPEVRDLVLDKFSLNEKFLLFVGTLEPRKNLAFLLSLMPDLFTKGFSLLIVGKEGWGERELGVVSQENYPMKAIKFTGYISTDDLITLYHLANVYVSTSLNEGFGLPQLEAMSCGCPVVCPHNSAMIEIVEGAGATVKGWDRDKWISTIEEVSRNREFYIERGLSRSSAYSWNNVVNRLTNYLKDA